MAQFYLLSVITNIIAGLSLAGDYLSERFAFLSGFKTVREASDGRPLHKVASSALSYRVPLGIAGAAVAVIHFLFPAVLLL